MESSMVSSPNNSDLSSEPVQSSSIDHEEEVKDTDEEGSPEESGWTEYLADFEYARRKEGRRDDDYDEEISHGDDEYSYSMMSSASMVSDAGTGPEWKLRNHITINNMCSNNMPKMLNLKRAKEMMSYDDSLEDTASSPVNSPKITMGLKRMDINCRTADETFDNYHGKGRVIENQHDDVEVLKATNINGSTPVVDQQGKLLGEKGFCLVPVTMFMNFNNYHRLHRF